MAVLCGMHDLLANFIAFHIWDYYQTFFLDMEKIFIIVMLLLVKQPGKLHFLRQPEDWCNQLTIPHVKQITEYKFRIWILVMKYIYLSSLYLSSSKSPNVFASSLFPIKRLFLEFTILLNNLTLDYRIRQIIKINNRFKFQCHQTSFHLSIHKLYTKECLIHIKCTS